MDVPAGTIATYSQSSAAPATSPPFVLESFPHGKMSFFSRIASYLGTEVAAKALANNKLFQWFALNTVGALFVATR